MTRFNFKSLLIVSLKSYFDMLQFLAKIKKTCAVI